MRVHENLCRPYGTRVPYPLLPGTSVPGFHMPPLRGWILQIFVDPSLLNLVPTHTLKAAPFQNTNAI